ncbi:phenylalanine--tRNA ligase subunit beta, partial [Alphaproteobacteria bacterium]|nr:phenylalanine--tRNA ligase subunit beta [Alphaproteobacteria bacterium]
KYNIESDARYRFERGVDPNSLSLGIEAATNLILELCGGQVSEIVKAGAIPKWDKEILFNLTDIKRVAAIDLDKSDVLKIFSNLGFKVSDKSEKLLVSVPSWRSDIDGKNDLIEELVRVYGYDKIPVESINKNFNMNSFQSNSKLILKNSSKRFMAYRGLNESITWSFISEKNYELFGGKNKKLQIINPISNDLNYMRPSILPNLIDAISRNISRGYSNICLFEVGPQYSSDNIEGQEEVLALVRHGTFGGNHWMKRTHQFDLYDVKADFLSLLTENGFTDNMITINNLAPSWYHPGRSGKISNNKGEALGYFGEINPKVLNQMNFSGRIVSAEIFLNKLTLDKKDNLSKGALNLYDLQSVTRDFSFIVNKKINSKDIVNAAFNTNKQLIISVDVFDVFEDSTIGNDNKSIAISVLIQPKNKTMTEKEIDKISQNIIKNVSSNTGAKLRN